jgi:hypothetical protein
MSDELEFTAEQWCAITGTRVLDPDGWRHSGRSWEDEITFSEFQSRVAESTVREA